MRKVMDDFSAVMRSDAEVAVTQPKAYTLGALLQAGKIALYICAVLAPVLAFIKLL